MRALLISREITDAAAAVVRYAEAHPIRAQQLFHLMSHPEEAPGHTPEHVVQVPFGFRCVFTVDEQPGGWMRHLSVSVDAPGRMPNRVAVDALMMLFGFKWNLDKCGKAGLVFPMHEQLDSVNVLEPYEDYREP